MKRKPRKKGTGDNLGSRFSSIGETNQESNVMLGTGNHNFLSRRSKKGSDQEGSEVVRNYQTGETQIGSMHISEQARG